ncbi:MAG: hydantoinase B/oxoprolinase family protein [Veillonellaceae bacterium]|nr:hydantoinase B/oxoprolinase family protein [Veillonellaceae bacterium]MDD6126545.1 hydantoinase B/oxoprolinase family protein [Veillonellaceae bacterium]MDD6698009.1 hydantoinase B/oxoprolinase family protein [Veillonellaceae bacterium]MDY6350282.1 hydantoinase B/oxoprolinase family protein [Selenomonas sp.]
MSKPVEPYLMSVLSSRLYSIGLEMTNTLMRTARSQLMSVCHDLSTAICDRNGKVIALAESIPVHCANMGLTVRPCFDHPEGIQPGDLFLNNSPYHGNTHHADYTYIAPVFHDGELMFFAVTKGHQADIGNSIPSTYAPTARDMFEEGAIDWPCIKIQKNYKDVPDIIAIAQMHNRVPEMWYGDYLACVGSSRVGEKRLAALCEEYGNDVVKRFCEAYQDYGARRMKEELKQLPKGHYEYDIKADAIEGVVPEITIHIECDTHPEDGTIAFDFTKNADSLPCGLNMCEATTLASAVTGVLNRMPCDIPCNDGAMSQIKVKMREGCVIGKAKAPYSSSMATTNLADRVISGVQALMNKITSNKGMAEGGATQCPAVAVVSGTDWRKGDAPYVNQIFCGMTGGPAVNGYDGWITYQYPVTGGAMNWNSTEVLEQQYPFKVVSEEILPNSVGAGQFDSAPSCKFVMTARHDPVVCAYSCDGIANPPKGAAGGLDGHKSAAWKYKLAEGEASRTELPPFAEPVITKKEAIVSESSSGGGYGDPLERDPELVCHRVREEWITKEFAAKTYGVVVDDSHEHFVPDVAATKKLREKLRAERAAKGTADAETQETVAKEA